MPKRSRLEQRKELQAFIKIAQNLEELNTKTAPLAEIEVLKQMLDENTLNVFKSKSLYDIKIKLDMLPSKGPIYEDHESNTERFNSVNQKLDRCLDETRAISEAAIKTKFYQSTHLHPNYAEVKEVEQDLSECEDNREFIKGELSIQGICLEAIGSLCMDVKTKEPIDPVGEPTQTDIKHAFAEIISIKCSNQSDQTIKDYLAAKFTNNDNPHTVGELAEYLSFDCSILSDPEYW